MHWTVALFALQLLPLNAEAMTESAYKESLQLAEKKVLRNQSNHHARSMHFPSSTVKGLVGRDYQVGDNWDVAAWQINPTIMRMTSDPKQLQAQMKKGGIFHYEVVRLQSGKIELKITQKHSDGFSIVDPRIESLQLTLDDTLVQNKKAYLFKGNPQEVAVSADGIHSGITSLELLPLDIPEVSAGEKQTPKSLPVLPNAIQEAAVKLGYKPDLSQCQWFEHDDFFGRPVQILWQQGDLWPAFIKTPGGISILIHKGAL